jgi:signal transduction histidine kinase
MNEEEALRGLEHPSIGRRLASARFLAVNARESHLEHLRQVLVNESVAYVRNALERAIERAEGSVPEHRTLIAQKADDVLTKELYAEAILSVTSQIIHELDPLVGVLRLRMEADWDGFGSSESDAALGRLEEALEGLRELNSVSRVPRLVPLRLNELLPSVAREFDGGERSVSVAGPELVVESSPNLITVIVRNALRNAIEASNEVSTNDPVLTWGSAGDEFFVVVLDSGLGPPTGSESAFVLGRSTKRGHLGVGLAIAQQAALTLGGDLHLRRRKEGGAALEFRAPKLV